MVILPLFATQNQHDDCRYRTGCATRAVLPQGMAQLATAKIDLFLFIVVRSVRYIVNANQGLSQPAKRADEKGPDRHNRIAEMVIRMTGRDNWTR
jgi:hypothetical protein